MILWLLVLVSPAPCVVYANALPMIACAGDYVNGARAGGRESDSLHPMGQAAVWRAMRLPRYQTWLFRGTPLGKWRLTKTLASDRGSQSFHRGVKEVDCV